MKKPSEGKGGITDDKIICLGVIYNFWNISVNRVKVRLEISCMMQKCNWNQSLIFLTFHFSSLERMWSSRGWRSSNWTITHSTRQSSIIRSTCPDHSDHRRPILASFWQLLESSNPSWPRYNQTSFIWSWLMWSCIKFSAPYCDHNYIIIMFIRTLLNLWIFDQNLKIMLSSENTVESDITSIWENTVTSNKSILNVKNGDNKRLVSKVI